VEGLVGAFDAVTYMAYDDYYRSVAEWQCNLDEWMAEGCDPNRFLRIPRLTCDLAVLKAGQPITTPQGQIVTPAPLIVLEEPWGRLRQEIAHVIDYVVHLDIPLDVSLARKLLRDASLGYDPMMFARDYLEAGVRHIYLQQQRAAESADIIVDGMKPADELIADMIVRVKECLRW